MYYQKYLSIYNSTCPCIWVCVISWWIDRLFVEFGHRASDSSICHHNNLQYVVIHQITTYVFVFIQVCWTGVSKRKQFYREAALTNSTTRCILPIYIIQIMLILGWTIIFSVIVDVSPWLCIDIVLGNRAIISFVAFVCILILLPLQTVIWDKLLEIGINDYISM